MTDPKVSRTYRMSPELYERLKHLAALRGSRRETEVLEEALEIGLTELERRCLDDH